MEPKVLIDPLSQREVVTRAHPATGGAVLLRRSLHVLAVRRPRCDAAAGPIDVVPVKLATADAPAVRASKNANREEAM
jgi:hypothetical protein